MGFRETSIFWKFAIALQGIGLLLSIVGFATNHLATQTYVNAGLWKMCVQDKCMDTDTFLALKNADSGWLDVAKGMMGVTLLLQVVCILLTVFGGYSNTKFMSFVCAAGSLLTVVVGVIGSAVGVGNMVDIIENKVFVNKVTSQPDYSYGVFMGGLSIYAVVAVLHFIDSRSRLK